MLIIFLKFIFLGLIQGVIEAIPVSSSGHLLIFEKIINLGLEAEQLEVLATITNLGSLLAVIILFKNDIITLIKSFFKYFKDGSKKYLNDTKYCLYLVIATIPAGIMGLIVTKLGLFNFLEENVKFIGLMLLVTGIFLFIIKDFTGSKNKDKITFKDAIIVGLFQVIALIPGISRSGSTIVGSMFRKLNRETAFNFSFLLYIPISIATSILGIKDLLSLNESLFTYICYFASMIIAFIGTYFSLKVFKKIMTEGKLIYFVWYCLIVGTLVILFLR